MKTERERLLTAAQLAEVLGLKEGTIRKWEYEGHIPALRIRGSVRFDFDAVMDALAQERRRKEGKR